MADSRPGSKYASEHKKPFSKVPFKVDHMKSEARPPAPEPEFRQEAVSKPKVSFTADPAPKKKQKEVDNFFNDSIDASAKPFSKARPDLGFQKGAPQETAEEKRAKEKNFFDDEFEDTKVPPKEVAVKPNFMKSRAGPSAAGGSGAVRASVAKRSEPQADLYAEFEVDSR